jgi:hypothetical protein
MSMSKLLERLKQLIQSRPKPAGPPNRGPRRSDAQSIGGTNIKDIENAPEGRGQEMAGHSSGG